MKSAALAKRLSERYDRAIKYCTLPIEQVHPSSRIIVGCVDNGPAREAISRLGAGSHWWIDTGNAQNYGQILIGNNNFARFVTNTEVVMDLPTPDIQRPEILLQAPEQPNCAAPPADDGQGPTINQTMAAMALEVIRRLIAGDCPWMQLIVDMDKGTMSPVLATPKNCQLIMKTKSKDKIILIKEEASGNQTRNPNQG